jgi:hypothetical protein
MASSDFFLNPLQLSVFYKEALRQRGHSDLVGWRSSPAGYQRGRSPGGVEVLAADGTVFRVATGPGGAVEVDDITEDVKREMEARAAKGR